MSDSERIAQLAELVGKLNEHAASTHEALLVLRKIMDLQDQRLENLENFMRRATGAEPNPNVGVPPSD